MIRVVLAALLFGARLAAADGLFGPEFTFTHNGSVPPEIKQRFIGNLYAHLVRDQKVPFSSFFDGEDTVFAFTRTAGGSGSATIPAFSRSR